MAEFRWQTADNASILLVQGFIRRNVKDVPTELANFAVSYYFFKDNFTKHGDKIKVNKSGSTAVYESTSRKSNTVYGNELIDYQKMKNKSNFKMKWTFKVSQSNPHSPGFWIGIADYKKRSVDSNGYAFDLVSLSNKGKVIGTENYYKTINKWGANAIIQMEVYYGSRAGKLKYVVQNGSSTRSVEISGIKGKYHLAVVLSEKGQKIEILNFQMSED